MQHLVDLISKNQSFVLSTHRESDGDGLGAQVALYYALKKLGKTVRVLNVDAPSKRYNILNNQGLIQNFESPHDALTKTDVAIIFDTNDFRMLGPLYEYFSQHVAEIAFIDHHPLLQDRPPLPKMSWIDTSAASTGEIVYHLIKHLKVPLDASIARALYTSVVFDTQVFKFIKNSPESHIIAADLLKYERNPQEIHHSLFGQQTIQKIRFLASALSRVEYHSHNSLAFLKIEESELKTFGLDLEDSRDVVDIVMNLEALEIAVLVREDSQGILKVSLRSKGRIEILSTAERLAGGGHVFSAGAFYRGSYEMLKSTILKDLVDRLDSKPGAQLKASSK
ncbi:MAG: bifunctional oligoribonuclease/PAP phosphatase NrnA [Bdellovibrionales bacterium]|nr:bifunctional oligoribonuclease/PAP phosphatase NrnA [Bdellovibrionales bacterium]